MTTTTLISPKITRPVFNPGNLFFPKLKRPLPVTTAPLVLTGEKFVRVYVGAGLTAAALMRLFAENSLH